MAIYFSNKYNCTTNNLYSLSEKLIKNLGVEVEIDENSPLFMYIQATTM